MQVTISAEDLAACLDRGDPVTLLDVRWALGDPHGREHYRHAHLPGAVFVDLDAELAAPPSPARGRHPLPDLDDLQAAARRWGVCADRLVVAYDDSANTAAARAWWLLRWGGHPRVQLLDGGLAGWRSAGLPVHAGDDAPPPAGDVTLTGGGLSVVDADGVAALARTGVVLDARVAARYRGETEPIDPVAGHVPGAVNHPFESNLSADGRFLPPDELARLWRARLAGRSARDAIMMCGSGVTACQNLLALEIAGLPGAKLYAGSWSEWIRDPRRPVARGR